MPNNVGAFIPEKWYPGVLAPLDQVNLAKAVVANSTYEGEIMAFGDTVHVATPNTPTVRPYTRGGTITNDDISPTDETLLIDQSHYTAVHVDSLDRVQASQDVVAVYSGRIGVAISNHVDSAIFGLYGDALTANKLSNGGSAYDITASTAGAAHVYELLVAANLALDVQNVPADSRWAVVSPYFKSLLMKDSVYFINGSALGDAVLATAMIGNRETRRPMTGTEAARAGFIGQAAGMDIYVSNVLPTNGSNRYCLYGQGRPISAAVQLSTLRAVEPTNTFGTSVQALILYGRKVFAEQSKALGTIYVDNS